MKYWQCLRHSGRQPSEQGYARSPYDDPILPKTCFQKFAVIGPPRRIDRAGHHFKNNQVIGSIATAPSFGSFSRGSDEGGQSAEGRAQRFANLVEELRCEW